MTFYAEHFHTVEVDSTFYACPSGRTVSNWAARTPEGWWIESLRPSRDPHMYLEAARLPAKQVCYLQPLVKQFFSVHRPIALRFNAEQPFCSAAVWPLANGARKTMVAELKRLRLRKINMSHDAKGGSRAGKPAPLSSVESVVLRSLSVG
jgi:Protein of unknown function DUF72